MPEILMFLRVPGADGTEDVGTMAREFAEIINEERRANGGSGGDVEVMFAVWSQYERRHFPPVEGCGCDACEASRG